jgi:hypothetical protein
MIKIVNAEKVKRYETDGSTFIYKEALQRDAQELHIQAQGKEGLMDSAKFIIVQDTILEKYMIGWEGIVDDDGTPIEYTKELLRALPLDVRSDLYLLIVRGTKEVNFPVTT